MRGFSKAARAVLALTLALCMVLSVVSVNADETPSATAAMATATRLSDGYYSVAGTVSGITGEYATILVYSGEAPANETIVYANQATVEGGSATFAMEVPRGSYTVKAGGSGVTADTTTLVANTAPVFNPTSGNVDLKTAAIGDTVIDDLGATDADGDAIAYSITAGNDAGYFEIAGASMKLAAVPAEGSYELTVQATDGIAPVTAAVTVNVTDSTPLITGYVNPADASITDAETFTVPTTVTAHIFGAEDVVLNATFTSVPEYVEGQEGTYIFTGAVNTEGYKVAEGVAAPTFTLTVSKSATVITSFKPIEAITAKVGTTQKALGLPAGITGLDAAGTEYNFAATWSGDYNPDAAAAYTFTAAYTLGDGFVAGEGLAAPTISVTLEKYKLTSVVNTVIYLAPDEDYDPAKLPASVKATYDLGDIDVVVAWPADAPEGWENGVSGDITISEADAAKVENTDALKASAEFRRISGDVGITANGMTGEGVITLTGTDTTFEAVYTAAVGAVVKYAFVVTNVGETASSDNAAWQDGATFAYGKDRADEAVEIITVFVKVNDVIIGSASIRDYKAKALGLGSVFINSAKAGHSALRVSNKGALNVTADFTYYNDADYAFGGTWTCEVYAVGSDAPVITCEKVSSEKGAATFKADDISALTDRSKAYRVVVTYSDETVGTIKASRVTNISDLGLWYSGFAVNENYGPVIMSGKRDNTVKFTLDTMDGNDKVYTGYKFANYLGEVGTDAVLAENTSATSEFNVAKDTIANGTYTLYAIANKSADQNYYDFAFGKTVYVQDSVTTVCNIKIDGSTYCVVGGSEAHDFVLAPHWGGSLMINGVTYEYKFYDLDGTELNIETEKLHDGSVKISAEASKSMKFATKVVLTVNVDGKLDKTIEKIIYVPWGIK